MAWNNGLIGLIIKTAFIFDENDDHDEEGLAHNVSKVLLDDEVCRGTEGLIGLLSLYYSTVIDSLLLQ